MPAPTIRYEAGLQERRRQAGRQSADRISSQLIAIANAPEGMDQASSARLAGLSRRTVASNCRELRESTKVSPDRVKQICGPSTFRFAQATQEQPCTLLVEREGIEPKDRGTTKTTKAAVSDGAGD